jgi:hypothetical protein
MSLHLFVQLKRKTDLEKAVEEKKDKVRREKLKNKDDLTEICDGFNSEMRAEDLSSAVDQKKSQAVRFLFFSTSVPFESHPRKNRAFGGEILRTFLFSPFHPVIQEKAVKSATEKLQKDRQELHQAKGKYDLMFDRKNSVENKIKGTSTDLASSIRHSGWSL